MRHADQGQVCYRSGRSCKPLTGGNRIITGFPSQDTVTWQNPEDETDFETVADWQNNMTLHDGNVITGSLIESSRMVSNESAPFFSMFCETEIPDGAIYSRSFSDLYNEVSHSGEK